MDAPRARSFRRTVRIGLGMITAVLLTAAGLAVATPASADVSTDARPQGIDVSHFQGNIDWKKAKKDGVQFAWIKATEGTGYTDPKFGANYRGAYKAGVIRGAYHFARPGSSGGGAQAKYFVKHGGAWSADGKTLPGALDLEAGCSGLSQKQMRNWISDFHDTYLAKTGRHVVIYTTASWWKSCTGGWKGLGKKSPMWVAHWGVSTPSVPNGWSTWTAWQYTSGGHVNGVSGKVDRNRFNGSRDRLVALANNK